MTPRFRDFLLLLVCRPYRAAVIAWWRLCRKRLRARHRLEREIASLPFAHKRWLASCGQKDLATLAGLERSAAICVHMHFAVGDTAVSIRRAVASVLRQSTPPLKLLVTTADGHVPSFRGKAAIEFLPGAFASQVEGLHAAISIARNLGATHLVPLTAGRTLPKHGLAAYAAHYLTAADTSSSLLLYGDQDEQRQCGLRAAVWLKPQWDWRMFLSQDYVSAACALPVSATIHGLAASGKNRPRSLYELVLYLASTQSVCVRHVPRVTARTPLNEWLEPRPERIAAVARAVGPHAQVSPGEYGTTRVRWRLPEVPPKVSIIVPTRDRVELLRTCVDGLLYNTDYPDFEVIIADNDSREPEALAYLDAIATDSRVRVVRWPHPFNYSAINNHAAGFAQGRFLCLLNNDIEIVDSSWLDELMREALQPGIGAVGARLLYPDRSIQHAGVVIGLGNAAGHAHRALPEGEPGYFAQSLIARGASAVTGACLLLEKSHFEAVGGLDETDLAVAYNDVDLCLKLQRHIGLTNLYVPAAVLIHHESKSRGFDFAPEHLKRYMRELAVFQQRWDTTKTVDPWHHHRLDRTSETYRIGPP